MISLPVSARYKTRIMCARTGRCVKESPWRKNLVLDQGLNAFAGETITSMNSNNVPDNFQTMRIGNGTNPTSIASGGITFTQAGTTLTASGGFFTPSMAGALFKWGSGSGGTEVYIASYTDSTHVELAESATVGTPEVGTVWLVNQVALQTLLYSTNTYQTGAGDNSATFDGVDTVTFQRTYINPVQASPYTVNELGFSSATTGTNVGGRLVLPSSDVVGTSNFYVIVFQLSIKVAPATPTAVANVGTNCDTAGTSMIEGGSIQPGAVALFSGINSTGSTASGNNGLLDRANSFAWLRMLTATYSQKSAPDTTNLNPSGISVATLGGWAKVGGVRGTMQKTNSASTTTAGQTWYGVGLWYNTPALVWDIKFTTPGTLPTGTFQPITTIRATFDRTLVN